MYVYVYVYIYIYIYVLVVPQIPSAFVANTVRLVYVAMETYSNGKLRHLCGDPVCPDPVWKLSKSERDEWGQH